MIYIKLLCCHMALMILRCFAFSRKDRSHQTYLQIVQTSRGKGRVRQKIIANLGRLDELIA